MTTGKLDMTAVRRAVDRILMGDIEPMLEILDDDVVFEVSVGGDTPICLEDSGKKPVVDYFTALGGLVSFWQMDYAARGGHLIAWGRESFTIKECELEGGCEFALVFDLTDDRITRFLVVEDLRSFIRDPQPSTNFFNPPSMTPQFFSEWSRASGLGLLSCVSETRVLSPSADNWMVTV
jgi:hypothetical protein